MGALPSVSTDAAASAVSVSVVLLCESWERDISSGKRIIFELVRPSFSEGLAIMKLFSLLSPTA